MATSVNWFEQADQSYFLVMTLKAGQTQHKKLTCQILNHIWITNLEKLVIMVLTCNEGKYL